MNIKNKFARTMFLLSSIIITLSGNSQQLAFPGADGYGKYVTGGRGGVVYEVTNLKDDGLPGSLRYAINQSGTRTIVFRVSGTIALSSRLTISNGDLTIAGQTAPGDGICIRNHKVDIRASNVIVRYIRFRLGENWGEDAFGGFSPKNSAGSGSLPVKNIMIDHCSVSYGCDETLSIYDIENLTVQWCIISESLNRDGHGFGGIMGGWGGSLHHNVFAHHKNRSPRFCGARYQFNLQNELVDMRNNVIYNAGKSYGGEGGHYNVVNNYYKRGSSEFLNPSQPNPSETDNEFVGCVYDSIKSYWYVTGNYIYNNPAITADNWNGGVKFNYPPLNIRVYTPFPSAYIGPEETAEEAFVNVSRGAGAILPKRDTIDERVIHDVINNTGAVPLTLADIPGEAFPVLNSLTALPDYDHDGMPNDWEIANGLDTNNAADRNIVAADGYTMLEKYLNGIEFTKKVEGVKANATSDKFVRISWADSFLDEDGYIIERATPGDGFIVLDTTDANASILIDSSANATNDYNYRIKAFNSANESQYSSEVLYTPVYFNLTISVSGEGTVSANDGSYLESSVVVLTAIPDEGWEFGRWSGNLSGTNNPDSISLNSDVSITARFTQIPTQVYSQYSSENNFYPNPVYDKLKIKLQNDFTQGCVIKLFDNTGKIIIDKKAQGSEHIINMENLPAGIYIIKIFGLNNETITKHITKQ